MASAAHPRRLCAASARRLKASTLSLAEVMAVAPMPAARLSLFPSCLEDAGDQVGPARRSCVSVEIVSTSSSPFKLRGSARADTALTGRRRRDCQNDPALIVGLALVFARQGDGDVAAIPSVLFDRLRRNAYFGDPACRLVLDWLNGRASARQDRAISRDRHASAQHTGPVEIVSASAALPVEEN